MKEAAQELQELEHPIVLSDQMTKNEPEDSGEEIELDNHVALITPPAPISYSHIITSLLSFVVRTIPARFLSIASYTACTVLFARDEENALILAELVMLIYIGAFYRDWLRPVSEQTTNAELERQKTQDATGIAKVFHSGIVSVGISSVVCYLTFQLYVILLSLPFAKRPQEVSSTMLTYPLLGFPITVGVQGMTALYGFSIGVGHKTPMMLSQMGGAVVMLCSYPLTRFFTRSILGLVIANTLQTTFVCMAYLLHLYFKHKNLNLFNPLLSWTEWKSAFKRSLQTLRDGIQPASLVLFDSVSNILTAWSLSNSQRAGIQNPLNIATVLMTVNMSIEPLMGKFTRDYCKKAPEIRKQALNRFYWNSLWLSSVLPTLFLLWYWLLPKTVLTLSVNASKENEGMTSVAELNLPLIGLLPLFHSWRMVGRGIVFGFQKVDETGDSTKNFAQLRLFKNLNRASTVANILSSSLAFLTGFVLNETKDLEAYGFLLSQNSFLLCAAVVQGYLVRRATQNSVAFRN